VQLPDSIRLVERIESNWFHPSIRHDPHLYTDRGRIDCSVGIVAITGNAVKVVAR